MGEVVEVTVCREKFELENGRCGCNPQIVFAHIAGGHAKWFSDEFALTEGINLSIFLNDALDMNIRYNKLFLQPADLNQPVDAPIILQAN